MLAGGVGRARSALEEALASSRAETARIAKEMAYFKLELVNREESYNKNFANGGSAPTKATSQNDAILSWMLKSKKEDRINSAKRKTVPRRASIF